MQQAISQHQYQGRYRCVYPIKVNQQRRVVEEVLNFGACRPPQLVAGMGGTALDPPIMTPLGGLTIDGLTHPVEGSLFANEDHDPSDDGEAE